MKILIAGDSFAAPWPNDVISWAYLLGQKHSVTNVAQAGVGEYKIYKQIISQDLSKFDFIIVCHTSPSRVHTLKHPVHKSKLHKDCDLIITDIEGRQSFFNPGLKSAKQWFLYHYDDEYQNFIYSLIRREINSIINIPYLSIDNLSFPDNLFFEKTHLDLREFWKKNRGIINHYTEEGHKEIYRQVINHLTLSK